MEKVVYFNDYINKSNENDFIITTDDIFNLFLIFKNKEELSIMLEFDINVLMKSLAKYRNLEKFNMIFKNILIEKNEYEDEIINLSDSLEKRREEKLIIVDPNNKNEVYILGSEEEFKALESNYDEKILNIFNNLMFYINNDLEFGIDNWQIVAEDEVIDVDRYPNFVTGEFIAQDKSNPLVKQKMKKRAIEHIKNIYK